MADKVNYYLVLVLAYEENASVSEGTAKKGFGEKPQPKEEKARKFQAIRGVRDILPPETALWTRVEQTAHEVFATYNFGEIRLPIFEQTDLFARSIGLDTDVVSKEMYTFDDYDTSQVLKLIESRNAVLAWQDSPITGSPGPLGYGTQAIFTPFTALLGNVIRLGGEAFEKGNIPRTPENEKALANLKHGLEVFVVSLNSGTVNEKRQIANSLKGLVAQLKSGDSISLRPEATASVCRAYIEHNMQQLPQPVKLYYMGPMFRRERPQKGRYRQFYQIGAEILGGPDAPAIDAEVIEMLMTFFDKCGLTGTTLYINSIGHNAPNCRRGYIEKLRAELTKIKDKLGPDSQRRIDTNPLRVLDSKLESEQPYIEKLPRIADHLCDDCKAHYAAVKRELDLRGVKYQENWRLVRGLDYYMRTTFEITAPGLGSQNAVCGGGRYDGLVELLGGPPTKGIGFAIGEDRLILALRESGKKVASGPPAPLGVNEWRVASGQSRLEVYVAWMGEKAYATAIRAAKNLRNAGFRVELPPVEQKFAKALGQADKLGAQYTLILGEDEVSTGRWTLKTLSTGEQTKFPESDLLQFLRNQKQA